MWIASLLQRLGMLIGKVHLKKNDVETFTCSICTHDENNNHRSLRGQIHMRHIRHNMAKHDTVTRNQRSTTNTTDSDVSCVLYASPYAPSWS